MNWQAILEIFFLSIQKLEKQERSQMKLSGYKHEGDLMNDFN